MRCTEIRGMDLLESVCGLTDIVWEVDAETDEVVIWKDERFPEYEREILNYEILFRLCMEKYVYEKDREYWAECLSMDSLKQFASEGRGSKRCEVRILGGPMVFLWHEISLNVVKSLGGVPKVLICARDISEYKRLSVIEYAVSTEYDYVVCLDANNNRYVVYSSSESGTPLPPLYGEDYEGAMVRFNRLYVFAEEQEELTGKMRIARVIEELRDQEEYVLSCRMTEKGASVYKKLRFSYLDRKRQLLILTRTDITAIREEERQKELLKNALEAANLANRAKSEFLSRMSHDIRTPMNAIVGMTAIAGSHVEDKNRVLDCLEKITQSSKLLLGLINEVLDMSKIESGRVVLSEEEFNLADMFQNLISMIQPEVRKKNHRLDVRVSKVEHEDVVGDSQRIQQVLMNIMTNAVKYTPDCGRILITAEELPPEKRGYGNYRFTFEDNGFGMKAEFLERIFEPFERAEDERTVRVQGTGLGMAIGKNIVDMMGGSIAVESVYGQGSRFTVNLEIRLQEPCGESPELEKLLVLVVDDDRDVCESTCFYLSEIGMDSEWTTCGKTAVEMAVRRHGARKDYFAIILDLKMPEMDGIETARRIRGQIGDEVPIIIISAYDWTEYEDEARDAGVDGFILKPLFKSRLFYAMKQFVYKEESTKIYRVQETPRGNYLGRRILIVEDNELNMEIAAELLRGTGVSTESAFDGKEAVSMVAESPEGYYDMIFMDIQMPVMNGYEAARAIRSMDREDARRMPIIAMTANAFSEDVALARQAGMNRHLSKPVDVRVLGEVLREWLG